ncbi:hypothetical protein DENSPDRAFT_885737 [Dentipellis sp. KUC8613]|nr:hypothetical protein DENSPDRAFT_885737 [Dentipellis sp. KUC8613]
MTSPTTVPVAWNAIFIHADTPTSSPTTCLDDLLLHIDNCLVRFAPDGSLKPQDVIDLLGDDDLNPPLNVYNRRPGIFDWYYTIYTLRKPSPASPINSIVTHLSHTKTAIRGPALVVKNGPADEVWRVSKYVHDEAFARTVWWYIRSGHDTEQVFGERSLFRMLADRH